MAADTDDSFFSCGDTDNDVNKCSDEQGDNVEVKQLRPAFGFSEQTTKLQRSTSSPALGAISRRRSLGESGRLSDVSQLLFSSSNNIELERPATAQPAVKQLGRSSQTEIETADAQKTDAKANKAAADKPPPPPPPVSVKTQAQVVEVKIRPSSLPPKGDTKGLRRVSSKDNKSTLSPIRNTGGALKSKDKIVMAKANSKRDLLSRFKTYEDQLRPSTARPANRYNQLPQHSPKRNASRRQRTSGSSSTTRTTQSTLSSGAREDGVQMCSISSSVNKNESGTPESQRHAGLLKKKGGMCPSSPAASRSNYPRSIIPLVFDILRIAVIMFSLGCLVSRCYIAFSGKMRLLDYITSNPILWVIRWYIASFHIVFILIELNVSIPFICVASTLDNWLHKSHMIGFIGNLDLIMSSNKSLTDIVDVLQDTESARTVGMEVAFVMLGLCARGLICSSVIYFILGLLHFPKRKLSSEPVGLTKRHNRITTSVSS